MSELGMLPPEVTSAMIYAGPGSGSMMAAAAAWNGIAAELTSAALGYDQIITQLSSEEWMGPASASMASAAQPYVQWMTTTAGQAEEAAAQAQNAAAAYETVLASVVPPPLIALNRTELSQAMATNVLGQNNGIISQLEAQYQEFWAQNAAAMYSYAGQSAAAAKVTPYQNAPAVANPAAAAVTQSAAPAASIQQTLQSYLTQIQSTLGLLSTPTGTSTLVSQFQASNPLLQELWFLVSGQTVLPTNMGTFLGGYSNYASFFYNTEGLPYFSVGMGNFGVQMAKTVGAIGGAAAPAAAAVPKGLPGLGGLLGGGAGAAAHLGSATSIGKLSVPVSWTGATGAVAPHASAIPVSSISAAPEAAAGPGNLLGGMPLAGAGAGASSGAGPRYGFRPTVMARPPLGG
ncbi:PPE family protein [Mycobacterium terramassiliense]|uniref:PPE family protein n=1 Tax=Mycobacterium terramassiliense TaxID=1841859 RepID=A0A2U3N605_9MYCO|nr:PPE family protein [Mycobacterium terramassiliense]